MYAPNSPELFAQLLQSLPIAIAMVDHKLRYLLTSTQWMKQCGIAPEKLIGRSLKEIRPSWGKPHHLVIDSEQWQKVCTSSLTGKVEKWEEEYQTETNLIRIKWEISPWTNSNSEIGGLIVLATETQPIPIADIAQIHANEIELRQQERVLVELARSKTQNSRDLKAALQEITEATSRTLDIEKVSLWLWGNLELVKESGIAKQPSSATNTHLYCIELYEKSTKDHSSGKELATAKLRNYLHLLEQERVIIINDVKTDAKVAEFLESDLIPIEITSMLAVPIRIEGQLVGFLCCEHIGPARKWKLGEQHFAASIGDYAALVLGTYDRTHAKAELEKTLDQLQAVLDAVPGCISWFNSDLIYLGVNGYLAQTFKCSPEDFIGKKIGFLSGSPKFNDLVPQFFASPAIEDSHEIETIVGGEPRHFLVVAHKYMQGQAAVFIGFDITVRKQIEAALQQANEELELRVEERTADLTTAIEQLEEEIVHRERVEEVLQFTQFAVNQAADAIFWVTKNGQFFYVNDAACLSLGYTLAELVSLTLHDINPDFPPEVWPDYWEEIKEFGSVRLESYHCPKVGEPFPVEITVSYLKFNNKEYNCIFARDISERKKGETELYAAKSAADAANEAKSNFLANMSHELRTPLTAIIGYSELLQEDAQAFESVTPEFLSDLQSINTSGKELLAVINDIVDLSNIELNRIKFHPAYFDVSGLIQEVKNSIEPLFKANQNSLQINFSPAIINMYADREKVKQILINLLNHAAKSSHGSTIKLDIIQEHNPDFRVLNTQSRSNQIAPFGHHHASENNLEWIRFSINDLETKITVEQLKTIFEAYPGHLDLTKRIYGGTGLGLANSLSFCQMMGGDIIAESDMEQGSTFTVYLPVFVYNS